MVGEMNRLFFILKDNMREIVAGQSKLTERISRINRMQSIKLSFNRYVSEMLSKNTERP